MKPQRLDMGTGKTAEICIGCFGADSLSDGQLLLQAVLRAAAELELNRTALARVLGNDRSTLNRAQGIEPASKTGELALLFIRPSRCSALRGWLKSCSTSMPWAGRSERLGPEEIYDKPTQRPKSSAQLCAKRRSGRVA